MMRLYMMAAAGLAIVSMVSGGVWYVKSLTARVTALSVAVQAETIARKAAEASLGRLSRDMDALIGHQQALAAETAQARADASKALSVLRGHDLAKIARKKPALLTRAMQRGTRKVFKDLEEASQ